MERAGEFQVFKLYVLESIGVLVSSVAVATVIKMSRGIRSYVDQVVKMVEMLGSEAVPRKSSFVHSLGLREALLSFSVFLLQSSRLSWRKTI